MNEKEMWSHPLSMEEKRKISEYHQRVHDESNQIAQKIITIRYRLLPMESGYETESDYKYFHDFQIYQKRICDWLFILFSGLSELGISGTSKRMIPGILLRHENEIRQMFNERLPLSVAVKECIYRFYHIEILLCPRTLRKIKQYSMYEHDKKKIKSTDKNDLSFRIDDLGEDPFTFVSLGNKVTILINKVDILRSTVHDAVGHRGLRPEEMLQTDLMQAGKCLIGMCRCGDEECDPYYVDISINDDTVIWNDPQAKCRYKFDKTEYGLAIKKLQKMLTDYVSNTPYKPTKEDLEEYKKEVYELLTGRLEVSEATAKSGIKDYEECFEKCMEEHKSAIYVATDIWFRIIRPINLPTTPHKSDLEDFRKEVYDYLTKQLEVSIKTAKNLMKNSPIGYEQYSSGVATTATAILYGLLNTESVIIEQNSTNTVSKKNLHFKIERHRYVDQNWYKYESYEVRPFIKNIDMLGDNYIGLSPKKMLEILKKNKFFKSGRLWLGFWIDISINNDTVIWKGWHEFDKTEYCSAIKALTEYLVKYEKKIKEYKKAIYEWLTQKMEIPATVAKSQIKFYEKWGCCQDFINAYSVPLIARKIVGEEEEI